jgi:GT2 family glycosyltransferase
MKKTTSQQPLVSVVIPVFNKCELTAQCLDGMLKVGARAPFEVIVVDDCSSDETPRLLAQCTNFVRSFRNARNQGFAESCNRGAAEAVGKHLFFLNNDTIPLQGWLDGLCDELAAHSDVVAVGSKLLYPDGLVQHAGVAFGRETRSPYHPNRLIHGDDPRVNKRRELQAVTAASFMIRAAWFRDCGTFSDKFQTGYEDLDLCLTIRKRGGRIVYQPKSVLFHLESQSPGRMRHEAANRTLFFDRWSSQLLSDEDAYYFTDDLRIQRSRDELGEKMCVVRIGSSDERARWSVVAECQRSAAAGRLEQTIQCLQRTEAWPDDAAVRTWAGAVAYRLGERAAARRHFEVALALEPTPELRVHVAMHESESARALSPNATDWESGLIEGLGALRAVQFERARNLLEAALLRGAPPALVLPSLWKAATGAGDFAAAESARRAFVGLPHFDPASAERMRVAAPPVDMS